MDGLRFEHFLPCQREYGQKTTKVADVGLKDGNVARHLTQVEMLAHPGLGLLKLLVKAHDEEGVKGVDDGGAH